MRTKSNISNLITKDSDKSLLQPQKKSSFETTRILEIIDTIKYKSHVRDEQMYKQLSTYLKGINKDMITIDDFQDAFKKENIKEETNKEVHIMYELVPEKFEQILLDFVTNFVKILEGLREKGGDTFVGLQKDTNDELLGGLNSSIHTFQNIDELKFALKALADKLGNLTGKVNKNKRSMEKSMFTQQMVNFIKNTDLSLSECIDLLNIKVALYNATTVQQRMNQLLLNKLGYESWYHDHSVVMLFRKKNTTYDAIDSTNQQLIMSDIEEFSVSQAGDKSLEYGEIAVRKGDERTIFKEKKVSNSHERAIEKPIYIDTLTLEVFNETGGGNYITQKELATLGQIFRSREGSDRFEEITGIKISGKADMIKLFTLAKEGGINLSEIIKDNGLKKYMNRTDYIHFD